MRQRISEVETTHTRVLEDSHFRFSGWMHHVNWRSVIENSATFMNNGKQEILQSLAGAHSINPLVLLTSVIVEDKLDLANTHLSDQDFFNGLKRLSTLLVRSHNQFQRSAYRPKINSAMSSVWLTLHEKDETLSHFIDMYHTLLSQNKISLVTSRKDRSSKGRNINLKSSMVWPWKDSECWELSPTHNGVAASGDEYDVPAALDMSPSLYHDWLAPFDYLGSTGEVHAAHSGRVTVHSDCSLELVAGRFSTYYGHIAVRENINNSVVTQGTYIGRIELRPDKAQCNCDWDSGSYECATGCF